MTSAKVVKLYFLKRESQVLKVAVRKQVKIWELRIIGQKRESWE